jgi:hypothetical protein
MKLSRLITPLILLLLGTSACSNSPGPLAAGNSRIKVHCTGFDLNSHLAYVLDAGTNVQVGSNQDLSCIFSGDVYIDMPVPPYQYKVYIDNQFFQLVTFSGSGEQTTVNYTAYLLVYHSST